MNEQSLCLTRAYDLRLESEAARSVLSFTSLASTVFFKSRASLNLSGLKQGYTRLVTIIFYIFLVAFTGGDWHQLQRERASRQSVMPIL